MKRRAVTGTVMMRLALLGAVAVSAQPPITIPVQLSFYGEAN